MADNKVWGIHTKDDNLFLKENVVAIGLQENFVIMTSLNTSGF